MDFEKHRALWNTVVSGAPTDAVAAAGKLYELGEMSEKTFKLFVLATARAATERKGGNSK